MSAKNEKIKGIARHLVTLIGGILVTLGVVNAEDMDTLGLVIVELIGNVMVLWGLIASWINKDKIVGNGNAE